MPMEFINQNILLVSIVVISGFGLLWPLIFRPAGNSLDPVQATLLINREDAHIIDIREVGEFAAGHLPEAKNIPAGKLIDRINELEKFKDKPLLLCCAAGMRTNKACAELKKHGFTKVHALAGGVDAWLAAGYPVKKGGRNK
jgi:rhodanese-related sulfurtransferase